MAFQSPSPPPLRNPAGSTTDPPYLPLAQSGMGNPFFYHQFQDDFDNLLGVAGLYTSSGTGSIAHTAGDGGLALFSTLAGAGTFISIQTPQPSFTLPTTGSAPPGTSTSVKKIFYLTRIQLSDVTLSTFVAGLSATDSTPFTAILDGIWFAKAASSTVLTFNIAASAGNSPTGSAVSQTVTIPATTYSLVNATFIDLGFFIDRLQNIYVFVASQLVGFMPQSGSGGVNLPAGTTILPVPGAVAALQQTVNPTPFSTAILSPILGVSNGVTAAIKTMTVDFHLVQKER
jgi:hypothetical protein